MDFEDQEYQCRQDRSNPKQKSIRYREIGTHLKKQKIIPSIIALENLTL